MTELRKGTCPCECEDPHPRTRLIAITGGPGAGKTAVLEMATRALCEHVVILPEAASLVFSGGFPRKESYAGRAAVQRAIYHIQRELEALVIGEENARFALCDRGTVDSIAYWPGESEDFWNQVGSSLEEELSRYEAVIHLSTPGSENGYNHQNQHRIESADEAQALDALIQEVWSRHPNRVVIPSTTSFIEKAVQSLHHIGLVLDGYKLSEGLGEDDD